MNNVTNNDIMIKIIARNFYKINDVRYDLIKHCLRYINHIINLFVQTFLFNKHFNIENNRYKDKDEDDDSFNKELQNY